MGGNVKRHPDANCEVCPLNEEDCVYVPSELASGASLAIVGEAPGYQEAKTGHPFTGPSGRLLDIVLRDNDIERSESLVTNVCLCRPPNNATPPASAVKACWPRLKKEIDESGATTILALGNTAAQTLLDTKTGITKLRTLPGLHSPSFEGVRIIPTIHPAACLRQGEWYPSMVRDISKVNQPVTIGWEPPTFRVFDKPYTARAALTELLKSGHEHIVIDIEVGLDKDEFDHPDRFSMLCIGISYARGKAIVIGEEACADEGTKKAFRQLLETKKIICHNGKFDLAGLLPWCGVRGALWFDTMLASYCLDERQGTNSLGYNGAEYLGTPDWKSEVSRYVKKGESYALVPREVLYRYNAWDAAVTFMLFEHFQQELDKYDLRKLHDFLIIASNALMDPEMEGVAIDTDYNEWLTDNYLNELDALEDQLQEVVGSKTFNPRSPKQVKEYLESIGLMVTTTNAEQLLALLDSGNAAEFCSLMLEQRRGQKLYGTYVKGIRKRLYLDRVHPTFLLHGTVSGRLSCRNPNLQNIPRESIIRRQFIPAPGNTFLQGDYSQAELRVASTLSQDKYLHDVLSDSTRDIFDEVGERLYGTRAIGDKGLRIRTKAYVYGILYGREEYSIAAEYKLDVGEARRSMHAFLGLIPEFVQWQKALKYEVLHGTEDLVTPFGRHRRFWLITKENMKDVVKEAYSFYPQSIASDICLSALIRLQRALPDSARVRIPVHDSILVECKEEAADDVAAIMKSVMEETPAEVFTDYVPFPVEIERGYSWGELK